MIRLNKKILYIPIIAAAVFFGFWLALETPKNSVLIPVLVVLVLLIPGRVNGYYWREFYRGQKLLELKQYEKSLFHFERFLRLLQQRPYIKHLIWLVYGVYTRNIEAMTLNNIGVAKLEQGRIREAETVLQQALGLDPKYPKPYYNLAVCAVIRGEKEYAERLFSQSMRLGFNGGTLDQLHTKASFILAKLEGNESFYNIRPRHEN